MSMHGPTSASASAGWLWSPGARYGSRVGVLGEGGPPERVIETAVDPRLERRSVVNVGGERQQTSCLNIHPTNYLYRWRRREGIFGRVWVLPSAATRDPVHDLSPELS